VLHVAASGCDLPPWTSGGSELLHGSPRYIAAACLLQQAILDRRKAEVGKRRDRTQEIDNVAWLF